LYKSENYIFLFLSSTSGVENTRRAVQAGHRTFGYTIAEAME
jgi:hypothetical protein